MYVPGTRKIISSCDVVFDESFSIVLSYTSQPYSEAMVMRPELTYTPCATSLREQTGDVITLAQFEDSNLVYETCKDAESGEESDDNSIMPPLLNKEEMDAMDSGDESYNDPISTDTFEDIHDGSQYYPNVNRR